MDHYIGLKTAKSCSTDDESTRLDVFREALDALKRDLTPSYPKALLLFGSMARYLTGCDTRIPNDLDILMVGDNVPFDIRTRDYECDIELHLFKTYQMIEIAKIVRYNSKAVALGRLYSKVIRKNHSRDIIAACLLLGPTYNAFGIEQIEVTAGIDPRDYSVHQVLLGHDWWRAISEYARERRGPMGRFSDQMVNRYEFDAWLKVNPCR